jgi:hypothetical protein
MRQNLSKQLILAQTQSQDLAKKVIEGRSELKRYYDFEKNNLKETKSNKE